MDLAAVMFDVGDTVTGWGEIRDDGDGVWFDPPHPIPLVGLPPGQRRPRSRNAVRLLDLDWPRIAEQTATQPGPVWSSITGIWRGDDLRVLSQRLAPPSGRPQEAFPDWSVPPCPAPEGGWPIGDQLDLVDLDLLQSSENCVTTVTYRPRPDIVVLVIAVTDVAAAEAQWRSLVGSRLCVVSSRWSKQQLEEITARLVANYRTWGISMVSRRVDNDAQSWVEAEVLRITPDLAAWAQALPDGVLELRPTLVPLNAARGSKVVAAEQDRGFGWA